MQRAASAFRPALLLFAGLAACASPAARQAPGGIMKPIVQIEAPGSAVSLDPIHYRRLTRDDFRAEAPHALVASRAADLSAFTCARVVPAAAGAETRPAPAGGFVARGVGIAFRAEMDRACSWWNQRRDDVPPDYVLEHEQIHFAMLEITARELTARASTLSARGDTPQAAVAALQREVESLVRATSAEVVARQTRFDEDTSGRVDVPAQARWLREVEADLARTAPGAASP